MACYTLRVAGLVVLVALADTALALYLAEEEGEGQLCWDYTVGPVVAQRLTVARREEEYSQIAVAAWLLVGRPREKAGYSELAVALARQVGIALLAAWAARCSAIHVMMACQQLARR